MQEFRLLFDRAIGLGWHSETLCLASTSKHPVVSRLWLSIGLNTCISKRCPVASAADLSLLCGRAALLRRRPRVVRVQARSWVAQRPPHQVLTTCVPRWQQQQRHGSRPWGHK
jgi:hypothetical protein